AEGTGQPYAQGVLERGEQVVLDAHIGSRVSRGVQQAHCSASVPETVESVATERDAPAPSTVRPPLPCHSKTLSLNSSSLPALDPLSSTVSGIELATSNRLLLAVNLPPSPVRLIQVPAVRVLPPFRSTTAPLRALRPVSPADSIVLSDSTVW